MVLVFGGAYQGKLEFAMNEFNISKDEVLNLRELCSLCLDKNDQDLNYGVDGVIGQNLSGAKLIYGIDSYIRLLNERGLSTDRWIETLMDTSLDTAVIVMNDLSQGIVPLDPEERSFREANGRAMIKLAEKADAVYRVFCGIPHKLK